MNIKGHKDHLGTRWGAIESLRAREETDREEPTSFGRCTSKREEMCGFKQTTSTSSISIEGVGLGGAFPYFLDFLIVTKGILIEEISTNSESKEQ